MTETLRLLYFQVNQKQPEARIDQCISTPAYCASIKDSNPQCLCTLKANSISATLQLPGSVGGYTIFIVNAGANDQPVNIKLQVITVHIESPIRALFTLIHEAFYTK